MMAPPSNSGLYVLQLRAPSRLELRVGALGLVHIVAGWLFYVGSARRNLSQRVARHLRAAKPLRWHADYLSTAPGIERRGAVLFRASKLSECELNHRLGQLAGLGQPVRGFGASDCRSGCGAHLWWSARRVARPRLLALGDVRGSWQPARGQEALSE